MILFFWDNLKYWWKVNGFGEHKDQRWSWRKVSSYRGLKVTCIMRICSRHQIVKINTTVQCSVNPIKLWEVTGIAATETTKPWSAERDMADVLTGIHPIIAVQGDGRSKQENPGFDEWDGGWHRYHEADSGWRPFQTLLQVAQWTNSNKEHHLTVANELLDKLRHLV